AQVSEREQGVQVGRLSINDPWRPVADEGLPQAARLIGTEQEDEPELGWIAAELTCQKGQHPLVAEEHCRLARCRLREKEGNGLLDGRRLRFADPDPRARAVDVARIGPDDRAQREASEGGGRRPATRQREDPCKARRWG